MGELIVMPVRNAVADVKVAAVENTNPAVNAGVDLTVWKNAPRERTSAYFPTYSTVSRAIQGALRGWVREWFYANQQEVLQRPNTTYALLTYICTTPFYGRPTNMFTYDIQQTEALNRAFRSAAVKLGAEMKALEIRKLAWSKKERYFAYRSKNVIQFVMKNRRCIYRMLNVETMLMDAILKFTQIDMPKIGFDAALVNLRRAFRVQLKRFSSDFDFTERSEELLRIATEALSMKLTNDNVVALPLAA